MPTRLDTNHCWIYDPESLRIKRYLSNTRTYFKNGDWIRAHFISFFPNIELHQNGGFSYQFNSLEPNAICHSGANLTETSLPEEIVEQLQYTVDTYQSHISRGVCDFNQAQSSREFTIPDPTIHPELYWLVETAEGLRLIILWGLESDIPNGNIHIESLPGKLYEHFIGKVYLNKIGTEKKRLPANKPPSPKETSQKKSKLLPSQVMGEPPTIHKKASKRSLVGKVMVSLLALLVLLGAIIETSIWYLGEDAIALPPKLVPGENNGLSIRLEKGETVQLHDGSIITAENTTKNIQIIQFPKPGYYNYEVKRTSDNATIRQLTTYYDNSRNDMNPAPMASLMLSHRQATIGTPVAAFITQSTRTKASSGPQFHLHWGDGEGPFIPISETSNESSLTHRYTHSGIYETILLTTTESGSWEQDKCLIRIFPTLADSTQQAETYAPIADAEVLNIQTKANTRVVSLDLSGSYDLDGEVESITVNWGDGNGSETFSTTQRSKPVTHSYKKRTNRVNIRATAIDADGLPSNNPALLFLDFQSADMNNPEKFANTRSPLPADVTMFETDPDSTQLQLKESRWERPRKNKQAVRVELLPSSERPGSPLLDVVWKLKTGNKREIATQTNQNRVDLLLADGVYYIAVEANTLAGKSCFAEQRISINLQQQKARWIVAMEWISKNLQFLSISHYLGH